jgi:hypothetical protein
MAISLGKIEVLVPTTGLAFGDGRVIRGAIHSAWVHQHKQGMRFVYVPNPAQGIAVFLILTAEFGWAGHAIL